MSLVSKAPRIALSCLTLATAVSCRVDGSKSGQRSEVPPAAETSPVDSAKDFTTVAAGSRQQAFFVIDDAKLQNARDYTRLSPSSAAVFGVEPTDVIFGNTLQEVEDATRFSNLGEGVREADFVIGMARLCQRQSLSSTDCVAWVTRSLNLAVFEPKIAVPATDPYADYKNFARGWIGTTLGDVEINGVNEPYLQVNCVSCHSTQAAYQGRDGKSYFYANVNGVNSVADGRETLDLAALMDEAEGAAVNPNPDDLALSRTGRAAAMMAAQARRLQLSHADVLPIGSTAIRDYIRNTPANNVVAGGWLYAFASSAVPACNIASAGTPACGNSTFNARSNDNVDFALKVRTAPLDTFLRNGSRFNITQSILSTEPSLIPLRYQRPHNDTSDNTINVSPESLFAFPYITPTHLNSLSTGYNRLDNLAFQSQYLAAATTASAPFPNNVDSDLQTTYGISYTEAKTLLPQLVLWNYADAALRYHTVRRAASHPWPENLMPTMSLQAGRRAWTYVQETCQSCHTSTEHPMPESFPVGDYYVNGVERAGNSYNYSPMQFVTPASTYASNVMNSIDTLSVLYAGFLPAAEYSVNRSIRSEPRRNTMALNRSLTKLHMRNWNKAIAAMTGAPIAPLYTAFLPRVGLDGTVATAGSGPATDAGRALVLDMTGYRPRLEALPFHPVIQGPEAPLTQTELATFLHGYQIGGIEFVHGPNGETTKIYFGQNIACDSYGLGNLGGESGCSNDGFGGMKGYTAGGRHQSGVFGDNGNQYGGPGDGSHGGGGSGDPGGAGDGSYGGGGSGGPGLPGGGY